MYTIVDFAALVFPLLSQAVWHSFLHTHRVITIAGGGGTYINIMLVRQARDCDIHASGDSSAAQQLRIRPSRWPFQNYSNGKKKTSRWSQSISSRKIWIISVHLCQTIWKMEILFQILVTNNMQVFMFIQMIITTYIIEDFFIIFN